MEIGADGTIIRDTGLRRHVIRVNRRMSYTAVAAVLDGDEAAQAEYAEEKEMFFLMKELAEHQLRRKRRRSADPLISIFRRCKIILDEKGQPGGHSALMSEMRRRDIIEDFMLAANETVAEDYFWQDSAFCIPDS